MHKLLLALFPLLFFSACSSKHFTFNGLICPTDDLSIIENDLSACRVYDMNAIEKSLRKNPECKECLKEKGYTIEIFDTPSTENNASK